MSETLHHLPTKVGVVIGKEGTHGQKATSVNKVIGRGVVFAESTSENHVEVYDPANGQALQEVVQGVKDVGGSLSFQLVDWQWLGWIMGNYNMDEIQLSNEVGTFAISDSLTGETSGFTATVSARSGDVLTLTSISGTPVQGETFNDGGTKTATLQAFIHDVSLGENADSLTIQNIFEQLNEGENFLGMRATEATWASSRGEIIPVDMSFVGIDEQQELTPETKLASTKTPWTWDKGSIVLNGVNYDNVCDSVSTKIIRNMVARGGHKRTAHEVVPGNFKVEVTLDMDLSSSAVRTLRRANTKVSLILTYTNVANEQQATITLSNLQILSDVRDTSKDAETVRVSVVGTTGTLTGRIYDDIFAY